MILSSPRRVRLSENHDKLHVDWISVNPGVVPSHRPELKPDLSGDELRRWYWTKAELTSFARQLGIRSSGDKVTLVSRITATLDGRPFVEASCPRSSSPQLSGTLTPESVIPVGQRCSQLIRDWFEQQVGGSFHFDAAMREFFAGTDGTATLQDALDYWYATRTVAKPEIGAQFEFNRFTRWWSAANPDGTRVQLLAAWADYRDRPIDERNAV